MDGIFKTRLERFIQKTLGDCAYQDVSKVIVVIMTYVESLADSYELEPDEKKQLVLSYIQILIPTTTQAELDGFCQWIDRICEATKGMFAINQSSGSSTTSTSSAISTSASFTGPISSYIGTGMVNTPTKSKSIFKPKRPSCLDTSSSSS